MCVVYSSKMMLLLLLCVYSYLYSGEKCCYEYRRVRTASSNECIVHMLERLNRKYTAVCAHIYLQFGTFENSRLSAEADISLVCCRQTEIDRQRQKGENEVLFRHDAPHLFTYIQQSRNHRQDRYASHTSYTTPAAPPPKKLPSS